MYTYEGAVIERYVIDVSVEIVFNKISYVLCGEIYDNKVIDKHTDIAYHQRDIFNKLTSENQIELKQFANMEFHKLASNIKNKG
jgi:hypothetical protein